jgi:hypothetical protein
LLGVLPTGLFGGLFAGLLNERSQQKLAEKVTWSWGGCRKGVLVGLIGGLIFGLLIGVGVILGKIGGFSDPLTELLIDLFVGLIYGGLPSGLLFGLLGGLSSTSINPSLRRRPNQGIYISGWNAVRFGLVFLSTFGLFAGLIAGLLGALLAGLIAGLLGALFGGGVIYLQHYILRFSLWRSNTFPWQAIPLLEEATNCVLLQRVGGGYRFIHPLLQEHFASLDVKAVLEQETMPSKSLATKHQN